MTSPDLAGYFARIGHDAPAVPTLATLQALHARHAAAIPFENLAAFLGDPVSLELAAIERKLLTRGRGGWCFEHNMLFSHVLEAIGFEVTRLAARVRWNVPAGVVTPRSHMLLRVAADGRDYIADVGFGGLSLTAPLLLEAHGPQQTPHEAYRIVPAPLGQGRGGGGFVLQAHLDAQWQDLYVFDLNAQLPQDYEAANWYLATHPGSQFVKGIIAARAAPEARHALRNTRYTVHARGGAPRRRHLASVEELREVLATDFHVEVPRSEAIDGRLARMIEENPPWE
jgi:N-hydroxyarylamine O-acetyltransferase